MIIKKDKEIIKSYFEDNSGILNGDADEVYIPENMKECTRIITELYKKNIPITFSGSGTGMTGGRIPFKGAVLSSERLNKITLEQNKEKVLLKVEAGATLEDIKSACSKSGVFFPVNPTEETATIGASTSNNSSGSWTYKYGSFRNNILEIDFVTRNGVTLKITKNSHRFSGDSIFLKELSDKPLVRPMYTMPMVKNAAGYYSKKDMSLLDLIIGSEGTLGFISSITLKVLPMPKKVIECIVFFAFEKDAIQFVNKTRALRNTQNTLDPRALEFFNVNALKFLSEHHSSIPDNAKAGVVFEHELNDLSKEDEILESLLKLAEDCHAFLDNIWMADTPKRLEELRLFRHSLPSIVNEKFKRKEFYKLSTDSAVPDECLSDILDYYNYEIKKSGLTSIIFGHIGNNHFHVNLLAKKNEQEKAKDLYKKFMEKAVSLGGTISAEHGIGKLKKKYLPILYGQKGLNEMKRVKLYFDPKNLFNSGNLLDL
ncbi:MAG: FAD-binding oxidoreductase [Candidatus Aureabacteria bacterium]|nr:FAD-binding oxidoreductase [Candidatus Auribacterota bacterium]